jgi:methionyl-tRNA formyltransferase
MRAAFVTCVQLGLSCMEEIYALGGKLTLAFTLHDHIALSKSGRVWIDDFCQKHSLPLVKLRHINDGQLFEAVRREEIDWVFVIGWSQIAGAEVLSSPRQGVLGMHPTLLPQGRGRASIPSAILKDLRQTGVTLFKLDEGVDTGPILAQKAVPIAANETATTLYRRITDAHASLIRSSWPNLVDGSLALRPQDEALATVWQGRTPEDGAILPSMTAAEIDRLVRAVTHPYPGAYWDGPTGRIVVWAGTMCEVDGAIPIPATVGTYWATNVEKKVNEHL